MDRLGAQCAHQVKHSNITFVIVIAISNDMAHHPQMTTQRPRKPRGIAAATEEALALIDAGTCNAAQAAWRCRIAPTTIYRALKRRRERLERLDAEAFQASQDQRAREE